MTTSSFLGADAKQRMLCHRRRRSCVPVVFVALFLVGARNQGIHGFAFVSPTTSWSASPSSFYIVHDTTSSRRLFPMRTRLRKAPADCQHTVPWAAARAAGVDDDEDDNVYRDAPPESESYSKTRTDKDLGGYDPFEDFGSQEKLNVGDPQVKVKEKERSVTSILKELAAIQQQGPQKYCILGTRHCSYLHQQIIELLAYALVLSGNHVYTSGAGGTHAATIRGGLRAERPDLLTVVLPQSLSKQTQESQELLAKVHDVIAMPQNDDLSLDVASRICNSYLLSRTDQLISFAFHESTTVIEATKEAKKLGKLVTVLYLD